jgi:electron transfer flavoprotein beta subunit
MLGGSSLVGASGELVVEPCEDGMTHGRRLAIYRVAAAGILARMNVIALAKYIPDPGREPVLGTDLLIDRTGEGALDPGDEFAVEAALRVAEATQGKVTVLSMGPPEAATAVRRALAMGADEGVLVSDEALRGADSLATARVLAAAATRSGFDLIVSGVESTDGYTGTMPMTLAELLGIPSLTFARSVSIDASTIRVERQTDLGYDVVEAPAPVLVSVTAASDEPRYPTLKGIMGAKSKPMEELALSDLGLSKEEVTALQRVVSFAAAPQKAQGRTIEDDGSAASQIADLLSEAKVI